MISLWNWYIINHIPIGFKYRLAQLNDLWQQFCDLDEEVQQTALPTGSEYSSRLVALKELVEKYQNIFLDNMSTVRRP